MALPSSPLPLQLPDSSIPSPPELSADAIASLITQVPQAGPTAFASRPPKQPRPATVKKKKKKDDSSKPNTETLSEDVHSVSLPDDTFCSEDHTAPQHASVQLPPAEPSSQPTTPDQPALPTLARRDSGTAFQNLAQRTTLPPQDDLLSSSPAPTQPTLAPTAPTIINPTTEIKPKETKSTSTPRPDKKQVAKKTKKRKKLLEMLLPCFSSTSHDEEPLVTTKRSSPGTNKNPPVGTLETAPSVTTPPLPNPSSLAAPSTTTDSPKRTPVETAKHLRNKIKKSSSHTRSPARGTRRRTASDLALPVPVSDTVTPAGAAAAASAANAGGGGVQLPEDETEGVLSGAVVPPGKEGLPKKTPSSNRLMTRSHSHAESLGGSAGPKPERPAAEEESCSGLDDDEEEEEELEDSSDEEEDRIVARGGMGIPLGEDGVPKPLLAELEPIMQGRKCLVLDLDETLVHSSFKMIPQSDFVVPVEIENAVHNVYVIKRPGVDQFMKKMGEIYEVVVFTASLSKYADPVLDMLDIHRVVKHRLFRESCYNHKGNYVKDLSQLGRPIGDTIIIDNSPASYIFHPSNAVPVSSWFNDPHDTELVDLAAFLTDIATVPDVRSILDPRL